MVVTVDYWVEPVIDEMSCLTLCFIRYSRFSLYVKNMLHVFYIEKKSPEKSALEAEKCCEPGLVSRAVSYSD